MLRVISRLGIFVVALAVGASAQTGTGTTPKKKHSVTPPASQQDVQALRNLVQAQQKQIETQNQQLQDLQGQLHQVLDSLQQSNTNSQKLQTSTDQAQATATQAEQSAEQARKAASDASATLLETKDTAAKADQATAKKIKGVEASLKKIGPFNFSGDLRLRDEPFFGGPSDQSQVRNRMRYRLRFNATTKLNDDINGGLSLASGDINDPISTNQTVNQFYTRKTIAIDKAFINYNPHYFKPLTLTGGKFAYPWYNTELTWDKDLNPEGLAQTLAFDVNHAPVLRRIALVGFELPFSEVANTTTTNKSTVQSVVYGGQLQTSWVFGPRVRFSAYSGVYNYHNADPLALAIQKANLKNPTTPLTGALPLSATGFQNSVLVTTQNGIVTVSGTPISTGVKTITDTQFASKFALLDSLARFDIQTSSAKWPVTLIGDYVQNMEACGNLKNLRVAPANTSTATFSQAFSAPCVSRQRRGYWAEARFGRAQDKGDWQFAYTRMLIEREAVMSAFNASDIRQGSNVTQHRAEVFYQALPNVQLAFTGFFGRPLTWGTSNPPEDILQRYQFDVIYKF
ncbi:MAG TPA: putative porin [Terriglobales bacterium]|nr:putative porin [Terriglobales bacterium]